MYNYPSIFKKARSIVIEAGKKIKSIREKNFKVFFKSENDIVTDADYFAEEFITQKLRQEFRDSEFLTEETYNAKPKNNKEFLWILDPIDGTTNYYKKFMFYSISLALCINNKIVIGIVYAPEFDELFWTIGNGNAYKNKSLIRVSNEKNIKNSFLVTGFSEAVIKKKTKPFEIFKNVSMVTLATRRCGSAALDLAYVAQGIFDGFWEEGLKPWDIAAGYLLVKNANGKVTDFSGTNFNLYQRSLIATNGKIHLSLKNIINKVGKK